MGEGDTLLSCIRSDSKAVTKFTIIFCYSLHLLTYYEFQSRFFEPVHVRKLSGNFPQYLYFLP